MWIWWGEHKSVFTIRIGMNKKKGGGEIRIANCNEHEKKTRASKTNEQANRTTTTTKNSTQWLLNENNAKNVCLFVLKREMEAIDFNLILKTSLSNTNTNHQLGYMLQKATNVQKHSRGKFKQKSKHCYFWKWRKLFLDIT